MFRVYMLVDNPNTDIVASMEEYGQVYQSSVDFSGNHKAALVSYLDDCFTRGIFIGYILAPESYEDVIKQFHEKQGPTQAVTTVMPGAILSKQPNKELHHVFTRWSTS